MPFAKRATSANPPIISSTLSILPIPRTPTA